MTDYIALARVTAGAVLVVGVCGIAVPAHALIPVTRYAGPNGSGTGCTNSTPCALYEAIHNSPSNTEIVIKSGIYGSPGAPLTDTYTDNGRTSLTIHGETGKPVPLIYSGPQSAFLIYDGGTSVSHLNLVSSATNGAFVQFDGSADHLAVVATAASTYACGIFGVLSDSLCVATGAGSAALETESSATSTAQFVGVTALATDNGVGLQIGSGTGATVTGTIRNSILRGAFADVYATPDSGSTTVVDLGHTDSRPDHQSSAGSGTATFTNSGGNIATAPTFVDAAHGDYRETASSPTIDKGRSVAAADTDLAGNPRTIGAAPDMGAYEFLTKPHVGTIHNAHEATHTVQQRVRVNPEGLATSVRLFARHGHQRVKSHRVSAGHGRTNTSVHLKLHGLHAGTKYHVVAKAKSVGGTTTSHRKTVKTKHGHHRRS